VERESERKKRAEAAAYSAAVLPALHACSADAARAVHDNMKLDAPSTNMADVKRAFEVRRRKAPRGGGGGEGAGALRARPILHAYHRRPNASRSFALGQLCLPRRHMCGHWRPVVEGSQRLLP
jgi:hypothetical protein